MIKKVLFSIIVISFIVFLFWIQNRNKRQAETKVKYLIENGEIVAGVVTGKTFNTISNNVRNLSSIMYKYKVDSVEYKTSITSHISRAKSKKAEQNWFCESEIEKGDMFVVIYDVKNPEYSILCLDYPLTQKYSIESYNFKE